MGYSSKIFYSFLILLLSVFLLFLDVTQGVYDFRTKIQEDEFTVSTAVGFTTANVTLLKAIYSNDTSTIQYTSNISETIAFVSYNTTSRELASSGFTANATRLLTVSYNINALSGAMALSNFMDILPYIWYLLVISFMVSAIVYMWTR